MSDPFIPPDRLPNSSKSQSDSPPYSSPLDLSDLQIAADDPSEPETGFENLLDLDALIANEYIPPVSETQQQAKYLPLEPVEENLHSPVVDNTSSSLNLVTNHSPNPQSYHLSQPSHRPNFTPVASTPDPSSCHSFSNEVVTPVTSTSSLNTHHTNPSLTLPLLSATSTPTRRLESVASANVDHHEFISAARSLASDAKNRRREERKRRARDSIETSSCSSSINENVSQDVAINGSSDSTPMKIPDSSSKRRRLSIEESTSLTESAREEDQEGDQTLERNSDNGVKQNKFTSRHRETLKRKIRTRSNTVGPTDSEEDHETSMEDDEDWNETVDGSKNSSDEESEGDGKKKRRTTKKRKRKGSDKTDESLIEGNGVKSLRKRRRMNAQTVTPADSRKQTRKLTSKSNGRIVTAQTLRKETPPSSRSRQRGVADFANDSRHPSELTLWELVLRNKRIVTREEIEAKKAAAENTAKEAEALRIQSESANDDFSDLFNDGGNTNSVFHNQSRNDEAPDLFGSSDPLMTNSGATLRLDSDGNLLLEESENTPRGDGTLSSLFDGQQIIAENYQEMQLVKPFAGAYKYTKGLIWSEEDEQKFFNAISTFGLDLMMVKSVLPTYTYRQIRDKYKLEEKKRTGRVDEALKRKIPITTEHFESIHGPIDENSHYRAFGGSDDESDYDLENRGKRKAITTGATVTDGISAFFTDEVIEESNDPFSFFQLNSGSSDLNNETNSSSLAALLGL